VLYHYLVFDLCNVDEKSVITIDILTHIGSFRGKLIA